MQSPIERVSIIGRAHDQQLCRLPPKYSFILHEKKIRYYSDHMFHSFVSDSKQIAHFLIIIMILKALLNTRVLLRSNKFLTSKGRLSSYTPPPSQYETFKHHL